MKPGQSVDDLTSKLSVDTLREILGADIVNTIAALVPESGVNTALRTIAKATFRLRPEELFSRPRVRHICYQAMTDAKIGELATRIGLESWQHVHDFDPLVDATVWHSYLGFFGIDARGVASTLVEPDVVSVAPSFGLFSHQRRAADRVSHALEGGHGRVVLHMPTGAGKTRTAMHIICRFLNASDPTIVIWLAASGELLDQAADAFQEGWATLGNRSASLTRFWGDHAPDLSSIHDGLVVAGLQKMHSAFTRNPLAILRLASRTQLVVVDEAHQAIAPTYRALINTLSDTGKHNALLGLTATPGRTWSNIDADRELSAFFGERKVTLTVEGWDDPVSYLMSEGYLAKPTFRQITYDSTPELHEKLRSVARSADDIDDVALDALATSVNRNVAIITELERLVRAGHHRVLFFAASVRHAEITAATLLAIGILTQVVTGTTPPVSRRRAIRAFRSEAADPMVLCNYGVLTTGFDAPRTSAVLIARPTRSLVLYSQMVGRATRGPKAGGNETCEVSTVIDVGLTGFGDVAEAFSNWEDVWHDHG